MEIGNGNKLSDILGVDKVTLLFKSEVQKRYIIFYLKLSMERAEPENLNFVLLLKFNFGVFTSPRKDFHPGC